MTEDDWAQVAGSANALAELVERHREAFTSPGELAHRQYGAAGLTRGIGLMSAAIASHDAGEDEAVGVLTRAILESWISGAFVLFGGADSLARLEAERQRNERNLIEANEINAAALLDQRKAELDAAAKSHGIRLDGDGEPHFDKLPVFIMAEEIGALIEARTGDSGGALVLYNMLYRSYSTFDAHGLHPLERQLDLGELPRISMRWPTPWIEARVSVAVACTLLSKLGEWVFASFSIDSAELEQIFGALMPVLMNARLFAVAEAPDDVLAAVPPDLARQLGFDSVVDDPSILQTPDPEAGVTLPS